MRSTLLAATIAAIGLVGCVGGISSEGGDPLDSPDGDGNDNGDNPAGSDLSAAKILFDNNVYGIVNAKCTGGACHSETATGSTLTRFVATDASKGWQTATNYNAVVGNYAPSAAPILTKIKAGHQGKTYSTVEESKITDWLNKEVELRNGQTTPPPAGAETLSAATERVLSEFAGCMTKTNFDTANMANSWGGMQAQNNQECENCHTNGGFGFIATRNSTNMYTVVSTKKYYFLQYLTVDLTMGAAAAKVIVNETSFRGVSNATDPHREHPTFNATNNQGMTALKAFYTSTMAAKAAGTCGAPVTLKN
ncbi:MAG: hypothetical protein H0V07_08085 [Propionibacteriales bacterium]|nr:hypothetical protein [Propionibacteriales bacterium]